MLGIDNFEKEKKGEKKIRQVHSLQQLISFANPPLLTKNEMI